MKAYRALERKWYLISKLKACKEKDSEHYWVSNTRVLSNSECKLYGADSWEEDFWQLCHKELTKTLLGEMTQALYGHMNNKTIKKNSLKQ
jgi:hypothetical protein